MTDKRKKINVVIHAGLLLTWIAFNGILLIRHELWRDEANVWLMAKNLNPLQLFAEIKYQGHPCLWYLIVMPFAKLGLPFETIGVLSFLVVLAAVIIFLWKAPVPLWTKAICLFSPIFSYFYPCVARNYCLIALILIILAWLYPNRNAKPVAYGLLLGLLVQADTIAMAGAGLISLMWLYENGHNSLREHSMKPFANILKGIWIPLASFFVWVAQFWQVSDSPEFQMRNLGIRELLNEMKDFSFNILMRLTGQEKWFCLILFLVFLVIAVTVSVRLRDAGPFLVMTGSFFFQVVFSIMVYQLHIWHYISLCFVYLWMLWVWKLQKEEKKPSDKALDIALLLAQLWLIALAVCMFISWNSDNEASNLDNALHGLYSDGVNAAAFIEENISEEDILISDNVSMASTVLAYIGDEECYYAGNCRPASYANYNESQAGTISLSALIEWADEKFPQKQAIILIDSGDSCLTRTDALGTYEMLYHSEQETARNEEYTIYRIPIRQ